MTKRVLADTGAIVAYLSRSDQWNRAAVSLFESLQKPLYTCEAVVTEACFLMSGGYKGAKQVLELLANDILRLEFSLDREFQAIVRLMEKYDDVPMSLADACLVRMSELFPDSEVFTFDGDFNIYRRNGRQRIPTLPLNY